MAAIIVFQNCLILKYNGYHNNNQNKLGLEQIVAGILVKLVKLKICHRVEKCTL